jgi:hypothetical protein
MPIDIQHPLKSITIAKSSLEIFSVEADASVSGRKATSSNCTRLQMLSRLESNMLSVAPAQALWTYGV